MAARPNGLYLSRFDKPDTFYYIDPPYFGCEDYYGKGIFVREDFMKLRDILTGIKGKFILSINDAGEIRKLFGRFNIETVTTSYSAGGADRKKKITELLVNNFK